MDKMLPISTPRRQFGLCYLLLNIFVLPRLFAWLLPLCFPGISMAGVNFIWHSFSFLTLVFVFRSFLLEALRRFTLRDLILAGIGFALYWASTWLVSRLLNRIQPGFSNINDQAVWRLFSQNYLLMAISTAVLAPITEEILYRGILFGSLPGKAGALFLSSSLFALSHIVTHMGRYPLEALVLCFLQYLPAGLCLGWVYGKSNNILTTILIHMAINAIGIHMLR